MKVFPSLRVFCPMTNGDISGHGCVSCDHFSGVGSETGHGAEPQLAISCSFCPDLCQQSAAQIAYGD